MVGFLSRMEDDHGRYPVHGGIFPRPIFPKNTGKNDDHTKMTTMVIILKTPMAKNDDHGHHFLWSSYNDHGHHSEMTTKMMTITLVLVIFVFVCLFWPTLDIFCAGKTMLSYMNWSWTIR